MPATPEPLESEGISRDSASCGPKKPKTPITKKSTQLITIVVADQQGIMRGALRVLLDSQPDMKVVGEASDGEDVLASVKREQPTLALVDVAIPKLNGIELTKRIRDTFPRTRVLALTANEGEQYVRASLAAGASGYVPKSAFTEELLDAIRVVTSGKQYVHPRVAHALVALLSPHMRDTLVTLSFREAEVFRLIALGYTNKEIASRLNVGVRSVDTYKLRAAEKMGVKSRADIVRLALEKGWLADGGFNGESADLARYS